MIPFHVVTCPLRARMIPHELACSPWYRVLPLISCAPLDLVCSPWSRVLPLISCAPLDLVSPCGLVWSPLSSCDPPWARVIPASLYITVFCVCFFTLAFSVWPFGPPLALWVKFLHLIVSKLDPVPCTGISTGTLEFRTDVGVQIGDTGWQISKMYYPYSSHCA